MWNRAEKICKKKLKLDFYMNWILLICFERPGTLVFAEIAVLGSDLNKRREKSRSSTYLISKVTKTAIIVPASQS